MGTTRHHPRVVRRDHGPTTPASWWLVTESYGVDADDCVESAITMAQVTGSIGATENHVGVDGDTYSSATVRRIPAATVEAHRALVVGQNRSDRAFARYFNGEVRTSSAAVRLAREVEELQGQFDHTVYSAPSLEAFEASHICMALDQFDIDCRNAILAKLAVKS